jgi:ATP-dependent helicase HrpA
MRDVGAILAARADLHRRMETMVAPPLRDARQDVAQQLGSLVHPGFVAATGAARLPDLVRYLRAAERRLEKLPDTIAVDRYRMASIRTLEDEVRASRSPHARDAWWMVQELRVAQFAQMLGVKGRPSAKAVRKLLAGA